MNKITSEKLEKIVRDGIATDIFIAERAYAVFKTIGEKSGEINSLRGSSTFFVSAQAAFKDQFLLSMARLFDNPSDKYETRCIKGVINLLAESPRSLPKIVERPNLWQVMSDVGFSASDLRLVNQTNNDQEVTLTVVKHFRNILSSKEVKPLLKNLKSIRDKRLAHNELETTDPSILKETMDKVTFKDLLGLVEIAKSFVGVIGWAYMSTVFMHGGRYIMTKDAERPMNSLIHILKKLSKETQ